MPNKRCSREKDEKKEEKNETEPRNPHNRVCVEFKIKKSYSKKFP